MTQLGEGASIGVMNDLIDDCLMEHGRGPYDQRNDLHNNSTLLGSKLGSGGDAFRVRFSLDDTDYDLEVSVAAHHLIPGNESLMRAKTLLPWVEKGRTVAGDIGYSVNHRKNGVWLPGSYAWNRQTTQTWRSLGASAQGVQLQYAYAYCAMKRSGRPWHDRHTDYSAWVKRTLGKFVIKMLELRKNCSRCDQAAKKPWPPPHNLVSRLDGLSTRLRNRLLSGPRGWLPPFNTSRWAVMFATGRTPNNLDE
jgi:hypothetical protein